MVAWSTALGLGLRTSGARQLAADLNDGKLFYTVRFTLFSVHLVLGLLGLSIGLIFSHQIAGYVFNGSVSSFDVKLISIGVFFALIGASQTAQLQGLRLIPQLAKVKVYSSIISAVLGCLTIWLYGKQSIPIFVIFVPIITCLIAYKYTPKLSFNSDNRASFTDFFSRFKLMLSLGVVFMLSGVITTGNQFLVRYLIMENYGAESVGIFQASWAISITYVGFILASMGTDYFPRLTEVIQNKNKVTSLINDQTQIAIMFAAPVFIIMLTFSEYIIELLYSSEFRSASEILRWQILGDVFKLISWALAFVILAKAKSVLFLATEVIWNVLYVSLVYLGFEFWGVNSTGYAFAVSYFIYFLLIYRIVIGLWGFGFSRENKVLSIWLLLASILIIFTGFYSSLLSLLVGSAVSLIFICYSLEKLGTLNVNSSKIKLLLTKYHQLKEIAFGVFGNRL
nr:oligosaccharide flippase family protein [Echinimonas agarilytica]